MLRPLFLSTVFSAALLSACATSPSANNDRADKNPNATTVEVMAPEPVDAADNRTTKMADRLAGENTDVMGNKILAAEDTPPETLAAPALENLYYVAQTKWEMMKFIEAVNAADLATALEADGAMTVFAPTTEAFERAGDTEATAELLKGHIVPTLLTAEDLVARSAKGENKLPTLAGTELTLYVMGDQVKIADPGGRLYTVTQTDNKASNGVLHMINGVLVGE